MLEIKDLKIENHEQTILDQVSFIVHDHDKLAIIGEEGDGKSTLLKAILGEVEHTGNITFTDMKEHITKRIKIGYVPQSINIEKHMPTTVYDLFASCICHVPVFLKKDKKIYQEIKNQLKLFGAEKLIDKSIGDLSGGELQRVLLAIATKPVPNLLILDEPVSGIDRNGTKDFYELVNNLKTKYDMSILLVSHDLDLVKKYADKVILLDKEVIKEGTPDEVFNSLEFQNRFWR